jgi:hypothetical protein
LLPAATKRAHPAAQPSTPAQGSGASTPPWRLRSDEQGRYRLYDEAQALQIPCPSFRNGLADFRKHAASFLNIAAWQQAIASKT